MDNTIIIETFEEPKKRWRPTTERPPKEPKPRGRPRIIKQPKEPKKRGKKPKPKTEPVERRPRGRPRIYSEGTNGKPKDIDYFKKYYINVTKPKREALKTKTLKHIPENRTIKNDIIILIYRNDNITWHYN